MVQQHLGGGECSATQRAVGGLLGVLAGEAWPGPGDGFAASNRPVASAVWDLTAAYLLDHPAKTTPVEAARRHGHVPGTGWLLPVALAVPDPGRRREHTCRLTTTVGVAPAEVELCCVYVEIAARLFAGNDVDVAVEAAFGHPFADLVEAATHPVHASDPPEPALSGMGVVDSLRAGTWALTNPMTGWTLHDPTHAVVTRLAQLTPPWVAAAATGLVGLRHGPDALPPAWHHRLKRRGGHLSTKLGQQLVLAHHDTAPDQPTTEQWGAASPLPG